MDNAISLLQDRLAKAEARAARAQKTWESAKKEVEDVATALRVMRGLSGDSPPSPTAGNAAVAERQRLIVELLNVGQDSGQSPAELFEAYGLLASEEINIDTFRTTIWRMRDRDVRMGDDIWLVKGANGQYWKEPGTLGTRARVEAAEQAQIHETQEDGAPWEYDHSEPPF